ncbi:MAG: hypothetical protein HZA06_01050 [Nitrospirae bacterium]|nr:hypothetical protein [Nitrospirota bacterium]
MIWNYRVIEHDRFFAIHEVYYNDKGDITAISEDPMHPQGEALEELKNDMEYFLQAFNRPVLKKDEVKFALMEGVEDKFAKRKGLKR